MHTSSQATAIDDGTAKGKLSLCTTWQRMGKWRSCSTNS